MLTTGYLVSSFSSGRLRISLNVGVLLSLRCTLTAVSLLGYALAPQWWMMVALGFLVGLGAGTIDAGLNTYAATHHSTQTVTWLHACYGVGTSSGPLIMSRVMQANLAWQWGYAIVGCGQRLLAEGVGLTRRWWPAVNQPCPPHHDATLVGVF